MDTGRAHVWILDFAGRVAVNAEAPPVLAAALLRKAVVRGLARVRAAGWVVRYAQDNI
jgi:hypothetical protein